MLLIATDRTTPSNTTPIVDKERHARPVSPIYPQIPKIEIEVPNRMHVKPIIKATLLILNISSPNFAAAQ